MSTAWTEAHVAKLKLLWKTHTATEIASLFWTEEGIALTRSAVIGKLHRLGLGIDDKSKVHYLTSAPGHPRATPQQKPVKPPADKQRAARILLIKEAVRGPARTSLSVDVVPLNVSFDDLEAGRCKWPTEPNGHSWFFCGHVALRRDQTGGDTPSYGPWCAHHAQICFTPPRPSRSQLPIRRERHA